MSEKIVLTEQEAAIVEDAKTAEYPAHYIGEMSDTKDGTEEKLINAYVLGYETIKSKYIVYHDLPGVLERGSFDVIQASHSRFHKSGIVWEFTAKTDLENESGYLFTNEEIDDMGLSECVKIKAGE